MSILFASPVRVGEELQPLISFYWRQVSPGALPDTSLTEFFGIYAE